MQPINTLHLVDHGIQFARSASVLLEAVEQGASYTLVRVFDLHR